MRLRNKTAPLLFIQNSHRAAFGEVAVSRASVYAEKFIPDDGVKRPTLPLCRGGLLLSLGWFEQERLTLHPIVATNIVRT